MKRCQFVIDRHAADSRIDIMYRVVSAAQMCNRPDAGAAPWIVSAASCNRSNKQRGRLRQTVRCYCEYIDPRMVSSHHQSGKPHTPLNRRIMVRERQVWNITPLRLPAKGSTAVCEKQRVTSLMAFDQAQRYQVFTLCFCRDTAQIIGTHILTPAEKPQNIHISYAHKHT